MVNWESKLEAGAVVLQDLRQDESDRQGLAFAGKHRQPVLKVAWRLSPVRSSNPESGRPDREAGQLGKGEGARARGYGIISAP